MFVRASTLVLAVAASVIAAPGGAFSQCDTGTLSCCNQVQNASSATEALSLADVLVTVEGLVGIDCTPITVIGVGSGSSCQQQPMCCTNVSQNGLVNWGCSPLNLNL